MPNTEAIHGLQKTLKWFIFAALLVILSLVIGAVAIVKNEDAEDRAQVTLVEDQRVTRAVEACIAENRRTTSLRHLIIEQLAQLAILSGTPPEQYDEFTQTPEYQGYVDFVNQSLPFRQCSVVCVEADRDPDVDNCLPAINEQGDPP